MIRLLAAFGLAVAGHGAFAQTDDGDKTARAEIRVSAAELCRTRPIEGSSGDLRLTADADAELSSLLKALDGIGIDAANTYEQGVDEGVARSELALAIAAANGCEELVSERLAEAILGPNVTGAQGKSSAIGVGIEEHNPSGTLLDQIQGHWYSAKYHYGFVIKDGTGVTTITNAPGVYAVDEPMLQIDDVGKDVLIGKQIFTNGTWYPVRISRLGPTVIHLEGGGFQWDMCRPNWEGDQIANPPCSK